MADEVENKTELKDIPKAKSEPKAKAEKSLRLDDFHVVLKSALPGECNCGLNVNGTSVIVTLRDGCPVAVEAINGEKVSDPESRNGLDVAAFLAAGFVNY